MKIDLRSSNALVTRVQSNILQINATSLENGAAKMSKGMRGQFWQSDPHPYLFNHIVEGAKRDGTASITIGLRQKERTIFLASKSCQDARSFIPEIAFEQFSGPVGKHDSALVPRFRGFRPDGHPSSCPVNIIQ